MRTLKQLLKEFWLPFSAAGAWTIAALLARDPLLDWSAIAVIQVFAPAFFLASWMTGQVFRVRKQSKVEDNFRTVEQRLEKVSEDIAANTETMLDHVMGGDSFPELFMSNIDNTNDSAIVGIGHHGRHPLYDIHARIVNLNEFNLLTGWKFVSGLHEDRIVEVNLLLPDSASIIGKWSLSAQQKQGYNIFFTARNGSFTQEYRLAKVEGEWKSATRIRRSGAEKLLYEQTDPTFPRSELGDVDWSGA